MGLGKTLTMIVLVVTNLDGDNVVGIQMDINENSKLDVAATLVVVPPPRTL